MQNVTPLKQDLMILKGQEKSSRAKLYEQAAAAQQKAQKKQEQRRTSSRNAER